MINIAILGFGVVGGGITEVIEQNKKALKAYVGDDIYVKKILDLRTFPDSPFADRIINDFSVVEKDEEISIVIEVIGGAKIAYDFTKRALLAGKSVVTSNKELVATHGAELLELAREKYNEKRE